MLNLGDMDAFLVFMIHLSLSLSTYPLVKSFCIEVAWCYFKLVYLFYVTEALFLMVL